MIDRERHIVLEVQSYVCGRTFCSPKSAHVDVDDRDGGYIGSDSYQGCRGQCSSDRPRFSVFMASQACSRSYGILDIVIINPRPTRLPRLPLEFLSASFFSGISIILVEVGNRLEHGCVWALLGSSSRILRSLGVPVIAVGAGIGTSSMRLDYR